MVYGDLTATKKAITNALAEANLILENSREVFHTENNDLLQTINELQNGADGVTDHVHSY